MSTYLWKVTLTKTVNKLPKGLSVDVIIRNRTGKPNIEDIRKAVKDKYNLDVPSGFSMSNWDCELSK